MLLTTPLTTFLSHNTTPQLPTLLLLTPSGLVLSSASPLPASLLRTQATAASTLWSLYRPFDRTSNAMHSALPSDPSSSALSSDTVTDDDISSITVQLAHGTMVIRELSCGLIFVAIGPTSAPPNHMSSPSPLPTAHTTTTSPPSSPPAQHLAPSELGERVSSGGSLNNIQSSTPSIAGSVGSSVAGARQQAGILKIKRRADEVGKWLEGQLRGFVLSAGER
ncbi:hypothetical protein GLAREA_01326 [Glarea lozoyensis ATCC 20868]|uniref:Uncharacterized protein n=1 Tax=Glarea lozoyensis (strain ATCC 20868 / MF5171) TaxID=1116229 RepID=S3CJL6_GLAL2|nr:uncharacterized protein GLAREA_01326 [Glarea lozoyensis ATCC 20868]EPE25414.1 hypothetical protein GLAREA_01326 [Glarea lozoyensis ATCC 20868]